VDSSGHAVVVFDGECAFCNRWVDFLLRLDRKDRFRFTARQSQSGAAFSRNAGLPEAGVGSIVLVEGSGLVEGATIRLRSEAVLRMLELLGFPFSISGIFRLIPVSFRDAVYDVIARNRMRWFRRMSSCRVPLPAERARFI
jgi:predicted DCC family thiol-disulfide oxidoreductase YuxK